MKRDEWMLLPHSEPTLPRETPAVRKLAVDESLTEEYGEPSDGSRTLGGGVDFFSTLGTEVQKKPRPAKPDPDNVR